MFIHRLKLLNFRQHELTDLSFDRGLTGIVGPNGAGKTTLLEAIAWAMNLNVDVAWFAELIPSSENIAVVIWRELRAALPPELTLRIRLWETPRNYVDYAGEA